ncbi:MAG: YmdB family metallophosphoesterase [Clostridia bacterium]|nr:YmdB family metallophosphoesterase [Clostridia bacterium]
MNILLIGDIVGAAGCDFLEKRLWGIRRRLAADFVVANGENASVGNGLLPTDVRRLQNAGVDVLTGGNHTFGRWELRALLDEDSAVLRPHNYPDAPGSGLGIYATPFGKVAVLNLIGRTYLATNVDCPFRTADRMLERLADIPIRIVDFHAEATSEKLALRAYLDGRVSVVVGTHTHVQTADETVSPSGTASITDLGMTGPEDSILGVGTQEVVERFLTGISVRFKPGAGEVSLCGALVEVGEDGKARSIERIQIR